MYDSPKRHLLRLMVLLAALSAIPGGVLVGPRVASAQDDATVEIARQRFREGVAHYDRREYEEARLAFLQAYALKPHPAVLLNLAQSELRANYPADAANHFALYLRENPSATDAEKQEAELGFAASKSKAGAVEIAVDQEGADIFLDGEKVGRSPMDAPVFVIPGKHTVSAKSGSKSATADITVDAGESAGATLRLLGGAAAAGPAADAPPPPPVADDEDPGSDFETDFQADTGGGRKNFFQWYAETPLAWVGSGVAVLGLGAGTVFAFSSKSAYDDAENKRVQIQKAQTDDEARLGTAFGSPPCNLDTATAQAITRSYNDLGRRVGAYESACQDFVDSRDRGDTFKVVSIISYSVGGAAAVGTIVYYFLDPNAEESARAEGPLRARITPVLGPNLQGVSVAGSF